MGTPPKVYPYIPNSVPRVKAEMLARLGLDDSQTLFDEIPDRLKFQGVMNLPEPLADEYSLRRHLEGMLQRNGHCGNHLNFLGAGCAQHFVPAVCDEVNGRGEFLTAYAAEFYADHGKFQALFEFCSHMAELLDMDVVSGFLYDGAQAVATSLRMATRITGRRRVLVPGTLAPQTRMIVDNYMAGVDAAQVEIESVAYDPVTGLMDMADLETKLTPRVAAVLVENPSFLGVIETGAAAIGRLVRGCGAEFVVCADPISLGVLAPPAQYGATIACGDYHPLGLHMQSGGGQGGFIATHDDMRYIVEFKDKMYGLAPTVQPGEYGFANILFDRTSFGSREKGKEFTGTSNALWAITAGVYLALLGPAGMEEIGQTIMRTAQYAAGRLAGLDGVRIAFDTPFFKEFVVNFDDTGLSVAHINAALLEKGIFGGVDLSLDFPELGQSALYCVTEVIRKADIDTLTSALEGVLSGGSISRR
ncbi:MAG: aminomethyl-transferring glycine dehydrogenase subunit GcvPA [Desulfobacterales bacterium]|nr:aminomethyl-transferring glycine dehydrogenase subunit GcvPA [Desulfobacterales bacterium]